CIDVLVHPVDTSHISSILGYNLWLLDFNNSPLFFLPRLDSVCWHKFMTVGPNEDGGVVVFAFRNECVCRVSSMR
ncbi:MAG: hypothetical protein ABW185_17370, partial [Sedimenticola sp.]